VQEEDDNDWSDIDEDEVVNFELLEELLEEETEEEYVEFVRWKPEPEPLMTTPEVSPKPSLEEPPKLELKPLPESLKYAYLGPNESLPVIIASDLDQAQEKALLEILSQNKEGFQF